MTTVVAVITLIEFFGVGTLGSFNVAIELGRAWRQHEEPDAALLAGGLEAGGKFAAAVDLNGPNGKGHALLQVGQKLHGTRGGGLPIDREDIPARDEIAGGELLAQDCQGPPKCPRLWSSKIPQLLIVESDPGRRPPSWTTVWTTTFLERP